MATMWSCACGAVNLARSRICDACGADRGGTTKAAKAWTDPDPLRCMWIDSGRRCLMLGSVGTKVLRCGWHHAVLSSPRLGQEYEEFERWCLILLEAPYCSAWTHAPVSDLWAAVHGETALIETQPCRVRSCAVTPASYPAAVSAGR